MRTLFAIVFSLLAALPAVAAVQWGGAGWYQVVSDEGPAGGKDLWAGPFSNESACQSTLPSGNSLSSYSCKYFQNDPGY
jgi:hypothetical protein